MTRALHILRIGPGASVQDRGRPGLLEQGLSRGGAADPQALAEGAALLGQPADSAAIEMPGTGGIFQAPSPLRIALTGAPMQAAIEGEPITWNASHQLYTGQKLSIGAARRGNYGYLHVGGGIDTPPVLGSRACHLTAGLGAPLQPGDVLPIAPDSGTITGMTLDINDRCSGGTVRIVPSVQTDRFDADTLDRFQATDFSRDPRSNRMGVRLGFDGAGFAAQGQLSVLSEIIVPGDIQITGDGTPFVLLCECQTTGGYPRIGAVLPCDLPIVAQAPPGAELRFRMIGLADGIAAERRAAAATKALRARMSPLVRDPHDMRDLLAFQLIGGVTAGRDDEDDGDDADGDDHEE